MTPDSSTGDESPTDRRVVIFAGPPKTGSTSVQRFFMKFGSNDEPDTKLEALNGWDMPHDNKLLFNFFSDRASSEEKNQTASELNDAVRRSSDNLLLASEMISLTLDKPNGSPRLAEMLQWLEQGRNIDLVFHYRTPRVDQLLSSWKQSTSKNHPDRFGMGLTEFACSKNTDTMFSHNTLDRIMHPLRLIRQFRDMRNMTLPNGTTIQTDFPVILVDMSGVDDTVQHLACEVMKVPCRDGLIRGLHTLPNRSNVRPHDDSVLSPSARSQLEALFRNRDCLFRESIVGDPKISIRHQDTLWNGCPKDVSVYSDLIELEHFKRHFREIIGCPADSMTKADMAHSIARNTTGYTDSKAETNVSTGSKHKLSFHLEYSMPLIADVGLAEIGLLGFVLCLFASRAYLTRGRNAQQSEAATFDNESLLEGGESV